MWQLSLGPVSLQMHEMKKLLVFINYPGCGIQLQQQKADEDTGTEGCTEELP